MNKVGEYALKGLAAGMLLGAGLAVITLHPFFIIGAAVSWGIFGGAVGAIVGALSKDKPPAPEPETTAHTYQVQSQCRTPEMAQAPCQAQEQEQCQNQNHYRQMVCDSRVTEIPQPPQR